MQAETTMTSDAQILARPAATGDGADPRRWLTLSILLLAAFMNLLDVSIVNIAIPSIQRDLNASYADVQWALAGYTLAYALVLITGGRLGDTFGRKRLFLIGVTGFTIMSARSEEHKSEIQSQSNHVWRLLLDKQKHL